MARLAGSKDATVRSLGAAADGEGSQSAAAGLRFDILTIFPRFFGQCAVVWSCVESSAVGCGRRCLRRTCGSLRRTDTGTVDDRPFWWRRGHGDEARSRSFARLRRWVFAAKAERDLSRESVILLSAQGKPFTQLVAHELAGMSRIVLAVRQV